MTVIATITPAASRRFVTVEVAREQLGITLEDASDAVLGRQLDQLSAAIEGEVGRVVVRERVRELAFTDDSSLLLERTPVVTVHEVKAGGIVATAAGYEVVDPEAGIVRLFDGLGGGIGWFDELAEWTATGGLVRSRRHTVRYEVEYTGGYDPVPFDLQGAVLEALRAFRASQAINPALQSERLGDYAYTLAQGQASGAAVGTAMLSAGVRAAVGRYRRAVIA